MLQKRNIFICVFISHIGITFTNRAGVNKCGSKLLEGCFCGAIYFEHKEQFVVNCTNTGFNDATMLEKIPEETDMLIFTGNRITELPWNIFGTFANLSSLKIIDMSNNGIRDIKGKTYHHVPNVKRLILNHNNLSISSDANDGNFHHPRVFSNFINLQELHLTNAFQDNTDAELANDLHDIFVNSNLTKLYKLHLEQNEIKSFKDVNVFCDLPNLGQLYMGNNYLPGLNFNITCLKHLEYLDLEENNITKFTQVELDSFDKLSSHRNISLTINIGRNKFKCDSGITKLYIWLHETKTNVSNVNHLTCVHSKNGNELIFNLKSVVEARHAKFSKSVTVLLIVLVLIVISLVCAYVYLSREKVKNKLRPLFEAVTRKVHYTTIESQDV